MENYAVVYYPIESGEKKIPPELESQIEEIYYKAQKGKPSIKKKLDKLVKRYPNVPSLWNYLVVWYESSGNRERARQVNEEVFKRFPNYLFGIINKAVFEILDENFEEAYKLLGNGDLDISTLYPERKTFHITEYTSYTRAAIHYLAATGRFNEADAYIEKMKSENFKKDFVSQLQSLVYTHRMDMMTKMREEAWEKEKHAIERTEPTLTQFEEFLTPQNIKYQYMYEGDLWKLDTDKLQTDMQEDPEGLMAELHYIMRRAMETMVYAYEEYEWTSVVLRAALILAYADPKENFESFLQLLRQPEDYADVYLSDWSEDVINIYYSHPSDQLLREVKAFILEPLVPTSHKNMLLEALKVIVEADSAWLPQITTLLEELMMDFRNQKDNEELMDSNVMAFMIGAAIDIKAVSLLPLIEDMYAENLVSLYIEGGFDEVKSTMLKGEKPGKYQMYANAIEHIKALAKPGRSYSAPEDYNFDDDDDFNEDMWDEDFEDDFVDKHKQFPLRKPLPGADNNYAGTPRNSQCPCGSGKKYKRCHGKDQGT